MDWLPRLGPEAVCLLVLLVLAADRNGCSFYGRKGMAEALGLSRQDIDAALARLLHLRIVAHRPWRKGDADGVWQILPLPGHPPQERRTQIPRSPPRTTEPDDDAIPVGVAMGELLKKLVLARQLSSEQPKPTTRAVRRNDALLHRQ